MFFVKDCLIAHGLIFYCIVMHNFSLVHKFAGFTSTQIILGAGFNIIKFTMSEASKYKTNELFPEYTR